MEQGGGSLENFHFFLYWGVIFCPREGECFLRGQPMGIPPVPLPLLMCALAAFYLFCSLVGVSDGRFDASSIAAAGEAMLKFNSILFCHCNFRFFVTLRRLVFIVRPLGRLLRLRLLLRRRRRRGEQRRRQQRQGLHRLGVRRAAKV